MTNKALLESLEAELTTRLASISIAEASSTGEGDYEAFALRQVKASILSRFSAFLANNADFLPPKETVLAMLDKAIDVAFASIGRPFLVNLLKPVVKQQILRLAGELYDSIFDAPTEVVPRIEV